jgi:hypothetical protein
MIDTMRDKIKLTDARIVRCLTPAVAFAPACRIEGVHAPVGSPSAGPGTTYERAQGPSVLESDLLAPSPMRRTCAVSRGRQVDVTDRCE